MRALARRSPLSLISRATSLLRILGLRSSPLLTSTHLTVMRGLPVFLSDSLTFRMVHTSLSLKSSSYIALAFRHNSEHNG